MTIWKYFSLFVILIDFLRSDRKEILKTPSICKRSLRVWTFFTFYLFIYLISSSVVNHEFLMFNFIIFDFEHIRPEAVWLFVFVFFFCFLRYAILQNFVNYKCNNF